MGLVFYVHGADSEVDQFYAKYTNRTSWNQDDSRYGTPSEGFAKSLQTARTEQGLRQILDEGKKSLVLSEIQSHKTGKSAGSALELFTLIESDEHAVYVLKGVHQESNPHITLAIIGDLYHVNVKRVKGTFVPTSVSVGDETMDGPGGWQVKTKGNQRGRGGRGGGNRGQRGGGGRRR